MLLDNTYCLECKAMPRSNIVGTSQGLFKSLGFARIFQTCRSGANPLEKRPTRVSIQ